MELQQKTSANQPTAQSYGLHFMPAQLFSPSSDELPSIQELVATKATQVDHFTTARKVIREMLTQYIQEAAPAGQLSEQNDYLSYLSCKKALYLEYYDLYDWQISLSNENLWVFDTCNILVIFKKVKQLLDAFAPLVKKKHGRQNSPVKIQGFVFLEEVQELLCQFRNAAFPFNLYQENPHLFTSEPEILPKFEIFLQQEKQRQPQFALRRQSFIVHTIIEIGYEIEAKNKWLQEQQALRAKKDGSWEEVMHQIQEQNKLNQRKANLFYYQTLNHYHTYISKGIKPCLDSVREFITNEPLAKLKEQKLQELITEKSLKNRCYRQFYRIQKYLLKSLITIVETQSKETQAVQQSLIALTKMLQRWHLLQKYIPKKMVLENIAAAWKLRHAIRKDSLEGNAKQVEPILRLYVHMLSSDLMDLHQETISKIVSYDQELTYQLLTSPSVMKTLLTQEHKIKALIKQFSPLLEKWVALSEIAGVKNQIKFMQQLFQALDKVGRLDLQEKISARSTLKLKKVTSDIEALFKFGFDHEALVVIRPYLQEFKHILILLEALKEDIHQKNINRSQNDRFQKLSNVAAYFSQERPYCVFYELKSQILLFIALFKLGYHKPICQRQGQAISLRNHVLNLLSKIYQNNQVSNILLSRISLNFSKRKSSHQKQYYFFDHEKINNTQTFNTTESTILASDDPLDQGVVQLGANGELIANLKRFIKTMSSNLSETEDSCKNYLVNLMNLLESQLFEQERYRTTEREGILRNHYIEHLKSHFCQLKDQENNLQNVLLMEGHFYSQEYDVAWKMLWQQLQKNATFAPFLQEVLKYPTTSQLLKFLRVYTVFSKMNHLFISKQDPSKDIEELYSAVNANTDFQVPLQAIRSIYQICCKQRRVQELQEFFKRATAANQQEGKDYTQFDSCLSTLKIQTFKAQSNSKQLIKIRIAHDYRQNFSMIREQVQKYYLFNNPGLSRVHELKEIEGDLYILVESNPFYIASSQPHQSVIRGAVSHFMQNKTEILLRNFASSLIQAYHLFRIGKHLQRIQLTQIQVDDQQYCFNINPFFMFIQAIFQNFEGTQKLANSGNQQELNRIWLGQILQSTIKKMRDRCSLHFLSNYDSLIENLKNYSHSVLTYSRLLELPLFMTLHEKEMLVVYFHNKMSDMSESFFNEQRKLKNDNKQEELQRLRSKAMRNPFFRNHRYNFSLNGILERKMIDLKICQTSNDNKLDWLTNHKDLKISYEIPRNWKNQVKEYVHSFNQMMKCLRGAIAHKMENSYDFILSFNQEYPQLIDFLQAHSYLLRMNYPEVMKKKGAWLTAYFSPDPHQIVTDLKHLIGKQMDQDQHPKIKEAYSKIRQYCQQYQKSTLKKLKYARVRCDRCNMFLRIATRSDHLLSLLAVLSKTDESILSVDHTYYGCFLASQFRNHRQITAFGDYANQDQVKNYLTLNWWFYLETDFPCLVEMLNRIRYKVVFLITNKWK